MGSIPKAIIAASGINLRWSMLSADASVIGAYVSSKQFFTTEAYKENYDKQIFPRHKGSRELALKIESLPKYQKNARIVNGKLVQDAARSVEIIKAALFTIRAWYSY
jgi:hypothetical protein